MNSKLKIKVNISSTFPVRTRCKYCCGSPTRYFYVRKPNCWVSPQNSADSIIWIKAHFKRVATDFYLSYDPNTIKSATNFNHRLNYKGFRIRLHKNKGVHPFMDYVEFLCCPCNRTNWAFYQRSTTYRPEIKNRKGKYSHKTIFEY